jgi:hypothetical protein
MGGQTVQDAWERIVEARAEAFGHRNWIVVADSAYPKQVAAGVETIPTGADHFDVLRKVLETVTKASHVRAIVHLDIELQHLDEKQAPGIDAVRNEIEELFAGHDVQFHPHDEIISKLDDAGKAFSVLLLKTNLTLPYTSVFLQLDCGYWSEEAEQILRSSMKGAR